MNGEVRLTLTMAARPGCEDAFVEAWRNIAGATSRIPGNLRQTLVRRPGEPGVLDVTSDWMSAEDLHRWEHSDEQHELTAPIRELRQSVSARVQPILLHVEAAS